MEAQESNRLKMALFYAQTMHWKVIPLHHPIFNDGVVRCSCSNAKCDSIGKHPRVKFDLASSDPEVIKKWCNQWLSMNIGILTGRESNIIVVDVDPRHGGTDSLEKLYDQIGGAPDTVISFTGGRGQHILFKYPEGNGLRLKNKVGIMTGIDVRADGGLIVVEPSVHQSRKEYAWELSSHPGEQLIADCPKWLLEQISELKNNRTAKTNVNVQIDDGQRNAFLASIGGNMRHAGMSEESIEIALLTENRNRCNPPLDDSEVRKIARSIAKYSPSVNISDSKKQDSFYPSELGKQALHGLAGGFVQLISPDSEAHPAALLINFLSAFGNVIGRNKYYLVGGDKHYTNIFSCLVGNSSKARKGTSWGYYREIFDKVDALWTKNRITSGLSSGEGLIFNVRDQTIGHNKKGEEIVLDEGVDDKRLLVYESEFGAVLKTINRQGNTLSTTIRNAWDYGDLSTLIKNSPNKATGAHINIMGHITRVELQRYLTGVEAGNGFANRFLWIYVHRSKLLPFGGELDWDSIKILLEELGKAIEFSQQEGRIEMALTTKEIWKSIYAELSEGYTGLLGSVTSRAEAQVIRLSLIYSLLDCSKEIRPEHLNAALALWKYCAESAKYIFGDLLGDPAADTILEATKAEYPQYLNKKNVYGLFRNHKPKHEIEGAIQLLINSNKIIALVYETNGRPGVKYMYNPSSCELSELCEVS